MIDLLGNKGFILLFYCLMRSVFIDLKLSILGYEDSFEDSEDGVGERIMVVVFNDFLNRVSYSLNNLMIYFFKRVYGL